MITENKAYAFPSNKKLFADTLPLWMRTIGGQKDQDVSGWRDEPPDQRLIP